MTEIAILSGKGGTGKSTLCASFATIGQKVIVADCDVDAADMYLILSPEDYIENSFVTGYKAKLDQATCTKCGLCIEKCRFGAISMVEGDVIISDTSCDGCKLCSRLCPTQSITMIPSDKSSWYIGNYRNGKFILDAANQIIKRSDDIIEKNSVCKSNKLGSLEFKAASLITSYFQNITDGKDWFLLVRLNKELELLSRIFKKSKIPFICFKQSQLTSAQLKKAL